jgi:hypothetical protein
MESSDQVWEAWDAGEIDDKTAWLTWSSIAKFFPLTTVGDILGA